MLHNVRAGMKIAEDVYKNSQLLISKNTIIDQCVLDLLRYSSIVSVAIYDPKHASEKPLYNVTDIDSPTHSEQLCNSALFKEFQRTFVDTTKNFSSTLNDIALRNRKIDINALFEQTTKLSAATTNTFQLMDILSNIRYYDDSTYAHSLNVALLSNILGTWLHFDEENLKLLTVSGMLHDIGKILIPPEIIKKKGRLTKEEFEIIKKHPLNGYALLKSQNIDERIAQVAILHHEKSDGSGYPFGLKQEKLNAFSKIITLVDVYEAMTANRCYRDGICPFTVIKLYEDEGFLKYDPKYMLPFLQGIADTYLHNTVLLNDGRRGEIILTNKNAISRPSILTKGELIDLSKHPELNIVEIL